MQLVGVVRLATHRTEDEAEVRIAAQPADARLAETVPTVGQRRRVMEVLEADDALEQFRRDAIEKGGRFEKILIFHFVDVPQIATTASLRIITGRQCSITERVFSSILVRVTALGCYCK